MKFDQMRFPGVDTQLSKQLKCEQLQHRRMLLMGRHVTLQLLENIHKASIFSLIADEATDVTNKEQLCTVNQKVCSSHQIKRESLVTIVTPNYGVMSTPHHLGVKCTPNLV